MSSNLIAALITFLGGSVISIIDAVISAKQIISESNQISSAAIIRQVLSFAYLIAVYLIVRKLSLDIYWPLIGAAVGLTVPSILFAVTIAQKLKGRDQNG